MDTELIATRDTIVQGSFKTIAIDASRKTDDILEALKNNRKRLLDLKAEYTKQVQTDGGVENKPSSRRQMIFQEIMRTYGALEGLKDELTRRGANFDFDVYDHEHPNAAYKRITAAAPKPSNVTISSVVLSWYLVLCIAVFLLWFFTAFDWKQLGLGQERATIQRPGDRAMVSDRQPVATSGVPPQRFR
jgi:hypothetical protein